MLITDAHNRMSKYRSKVSELQAVCADTLDPQKMELLRQAIEHRVKSTEARKKYALDTKLSRILRKSDDASHNDNWINNLSKRALSKDEENVLTRGLNFNTRDAHTKGYLSNLECVLNSNGLSEEVQQCIRQTVVPAMTRNRQAVTLSKTEEAALKSLRDDKSIIILPADKGRTTVVLDRADYMGKAKQLLSDSTTYRQIDTDPTVKLTNQINNTLNKLKKAHEITKQECWRMRSGDATIAQFYGLPKIHKDGAPLRPIVSLPGSPTYNLAKEMWKRLRHLVAGSTNSITNAQQFLEKIKNVTIREDEIMVSFDVTALFTSIDLNLAKETIADLLPEQLRPGQTLTKTSTCALLDLCLQTYFKFDGKLYQQIRGTPMGSPVSGLIAEAVMQRLETIALPQITPKLWVRYVDDTFVILKRKDIERTHGLINSVFRGISFTIETENNNQLAFLDVLITRQDNGSLQTSVYRKKTHTDQILNFNSNHPQCHKKSCIRTLFNRARTHCNTMESRRKEENHLMRTFRRNNYPPNYVRRCIMARRNGNTQTQQQNKRVVLPYIKNISELTARLLQPHGITVAHQPDATLRRIVSQPKSNPPMLEKSNVIYKIPCKDCNKHYVGQTGRKLSTRLHEHKLAVKRHDHLSLVSMHQDNYGHTFDWDNVEIMGQARQKKAREFLEAWYSSKNSINKHIDMEAIYEPLRNKDTGRAA